MIVLDSDVMIEIERGNKSVISQIAFLRKEHPENIAITSAVHAELLYGFLSRNKEMPQELAAFEVIEFDKDGAEIFARKKMELDKEGTPILIFDLITACCTIVRGGLLVSFDKHFKYVTGLDMLLIEN